MENRDIAEMIFTALSDGYDNEEERPETVAELAAGKKNDQCKCVDIVQ